MRPTSLVLTGTWAVFLVAIIGTAVRGAATSQPAFKAGFAERDITPDIGMEQPGGYVKAFHRKFHDQCKVRAAVFDDGHDRVAVVGIDALIIRRPTVLAARRGISEKTGIPPDAILIAASHDHSAGPVGMILPGEYDSAPPLARKLAYEKSSCANPEYLARVERVIVDAVVDADARKLEARCGVGRGSEATVSFNRRLRMNNGLTFSHPGQANPNVLGYAGPIDPDVTVIGAWDSSGKLLGCIVNFACHATTGPGGISADYICYLERAVRGVMGDDAVVVFLNGPCGDITQVDNLSPWGVRQSGEAIAQKVGGRVGAEAAKVLLSVRESAGPLAPLAFETRTLNIKRRVPSPEHVARAMQIVGNGESPAQGDQVTDWIFAKETMLLDAKIKERPVVPVEVQAIQIGPAVLLANPAEYFVQDGLDIKSACQKFPFPMVVELANDCVGYVPTAEAFGPHGGGYETRLTSYSNLDVTAGRQMAHALIDLASKLTPGSVPEPPRFKGVARPWTYGDVPPQTN